MKHLFIINPTAGKHDRSAELSEEISRLKTDGSVTVRITACPGDATRIARDAVSSTDDFVRIYSCGGDGTANEVLTGIAGFDNCALGVVPTGSGNDFVRSLRDCKTEDFRNLQRMCDGSVRRIDVIECGGHYSMNVLSAGYDCAVAENMERFKKWPLVTGSFAYMMSIMYCLIGRRRHSYRIVVDGEEYADSSVSTMMVVAGVGSYYGGGIDALPDAVMDDGLIEFMHVTTISVFRFILMLKTFIKGEHIDNPKMPFISHTSCKSLIIESDSPIKLNIEGQVYAISNPEISIHPSALNIIVPGCQTSGDICESEENPVIMHQ